MRVKRSREKAAVHMQVGYGKVQSVVAPNEIAVFKAEGAELVGIKKGAHFGVLRIPQEGREVDGLLSAVIEPQTKTIFGRLFDACDVVN